MTDYFSSTAAEPTNCNRFDRVLSDCRWFRVHREVPGQYVHTLPGQRVSGCRIDRILVPTPALVDAGWSIGAVGVELKAGGKKLGPAVCQAMDYRRACFVLPKGTQVMLSWVFLCPLSKQLGAIASVMAQHGVGVCDFGYDGQLVFRSPDVRVFDSNSGVLNLPASGSKRGSR